MNCQKCDSDRVTFLQGKCSDLCCVEYKGKDSQGYPPDIENLTSDGDYISLSVCLECGQVQGKWPQADPEIHEEEDEEEYLVDTISELHSKIVNHACSGSPEIIASDFPRRHQIGWACKGCNAIWTIKMHEIKSLVLEKGIPEMYPRLFKTAKNRREIARLIDEEIHVKYA